MHYFPPITTFPQAIIIIPSQWIKEGKRVNFQDVLMQDLIGLGEG